MSERETIYVLCGGLVFFSLAVVLVVAFLPAKEALYTTFASILGGFSGSLFTYLKTGSKP